MCQLPVFRTPRRVHLCCGGSSLPAHISIGTVYSLSCPGRNLPVRWSNETIFLPIPSLAFRVASTSFAGLLVVTNKQVAYNIGLSHAFIFASGALLTVSLLHLIPEAMEVRASFF